MRHGQPIVDGQHGVKILTQGRHLHIPDTKRADAGSFSCIAENRAGKAQKRYTLVVLGMCVCDEIITCCPSQCHQQSSARVVIVLSLKTAH
jgi:hypothetical protein